MESSKISENLIQMQALVPNMINDIARTTFLTHDGPTTLTEVVKNLPLSIFVRQQGYQDASVGVSIP
jgi:hypothetical protein